MSGGLPFNIPFFSAPSAPSLLTIAASGSSQTLTFSPNTYTTSYDLPLTATCALTIVPLPAALYGEMIIYARQPAGGSFGLTLPAGTGSSGSISIPSGNITRIVLACEEGTVFFVSSTTFATQPSAVAATALSVGFNWSGMETNGGALPGVAGTDYPIISEPEMQYYTGKGLLLNRLPILWERIQPQAMGALDPTYLGYIKAHLTLGAKYNSKWIIDVHNYGRYYGSVLGGGTITTAHFVDLWTKLSAALAGLAGLGGYDPMNEPHDLISSTASFADQDSLWVQTLQAMLNAIRQNDMATVYYPEGLNYSSTVSWVIRNPTIHTLVDPANLTIYNGHGYGDRNSSGSNFIYATEVAVGDQLMCFGPSNPSTLLAIGQSTDTANSASIQTPLTIPLVLSTAPSSAVTWQYRLTGAANWITAGSTAAGVRDFIVTGLTANTTYDVQAVGIVALMQINTAGVIGPNTLANRYKVFLDWGALHGVQCCITEGGVGRDVPAWNDMLRNGIAYLKSASATLFDYFCGGPGYRYYPQGITPDSAGNDQNQTAVLSEFTGNADAPTRVNVVLVNRGPAGGTSAQCMVFVEGRISTPFTVSSSSTVSGFTTPTISIPAGDNFAATFVITSPSTPAATAITFTNTGGLTNPPAFGFSTIADFFVGLAGEPMNVIHPKRIYTPYIGPFATLSRASDSAQLPVAFTSAGLPDQASAATWIGSSSASYVTLYDQGPAGSSAGVVTSANKDGPQGNSYLASNPNDYPGYVPNYANGLPSARFNGSQRMDAVSPINGLTGFTVFLGFNPDTLSSAQWMASWAFTQTIFVLAGDGNGNWQMQGESTPTVPMGIVPGQMNLCAVTFDGVKGARVSWINGQKFSTATASETMITEANTNLVNLGYYIFYPLFAKANFTTFIPFAFVLTDAQIMTRSAQLMADLGIIAVGTPGAMTVTATTTTGFSVSVATPPTNATSMTYQYRQSGTTAWTTAGTVAISGTGAQTYSYTGEVSNTAYDLQVFGTNGNYSGPAVQVLKAKTSAAAAGSYAYVANQGVNISGLENSGGGIVAGDFAAQVTYFAGKGCNVVRLPGSSSNAQAAAGGPLTTSYMTTYTNAMKQIIAAGMNVVVDISHNYGQYQGGLIDASGAGTTAQWADFWAKVATAIAAAGITSGYTLELMNEPAQTADAAWITTMNTAISSIRNAGFTGRIRYSPCHGGSGGTFGYTTAYATGMTDSSNNLEMSVHQYFDSNQSGTASSVTSASVPVYYLYRVTAWARRYGVRLALGEWGMGSDATSVQCASNVCEYLQKNADVWVSSERWAAGDFGTSYPLSICPTDSSGASNYSNPTTDAPSFAAIFPYLAGGNRRGQAPLPISVAELTFGGSYTYGAAIRSGDGGSITASSSASGTKSIAYNDLDCVVLRATVLCPASLSSQENISGGDPLAGFILNTNGTITFFAGSRNKPSILTTPASYFGQNPRLIGVMDQYGTRLLVNGTIVATSTSTLTSNPAGASGGTLGPWYNYTGPTGLSVSSVQILFTQGLYQANVADTAPTGQEPGTAAFWPCATDNRCVM